MRNSIRHRLLMGLTVATVTLWLLVIGATYLGANREVDALFDTQLEQSARVATRTLFGLPVPDEGDEIREPGDQYKKNLAIQVWDEDDALIVHSRNAPREPLNEIESGFADSEVGGERWRTYALHDGASGLTIRAGEPYRPRDYLTRHVALQTIYPVLIGLPLVILVIWFIVGRGFGPLKRLTAEVHRRDPDNLDRIDAPYAPAEVRPLVEELNALLAQLKHRIENERHFVADAAHELRTPLAGLKAQAEAACGARNDCERNHALNQIQTGVDHAAHLVAQLLTLSRLEESGDLPRNVLDIASSIRSVLMDALATADRHGVELCFECNVAPGFSMHGNVDAIRVLIRNLVDNAIKFSPAGAIVVISLSSEDGRPTLAVLDQGPGIPTAEREKVFDRFHRRAGSSTYGSGLGLSIVRRVVELHGAIIRLDGGNHGGLLVEVTFPPAVGKPHGVPPRSDAANEPRHTSPHQLPSRA